MSRSRLRRVSAALLVAGAVARWHTSASVESPIGGIAGRVVIAEPTERVDSIVVKAYSSELNLIQVVQTDASGRFFLTDLLPGRYEVWASRLPFVQADPVTGLGGARVVTVNQGLTADVVLNLEKGGAIGGTVLGNAPNSASGISVALYRVLSSASGHPRIGREINEVRTDSRGLYRFSGVVAGAYAVVAPVHVPTRSLNPSQAYATEFYPGHGSLEADSVIVLDKGETRLNVDFALRPEQRRTLAGSVLTPSNEPASDSEIIMAADGDDPGTPLRSRLLVGPDGRFSKADVKPGTYWLLTHAQVGQQSLSAAVRLVVDTEDIGGLQIHVRPDRSVSGTVMLDAPTGTPRAPVSGATVSLSRTTSTGTSSPMDHWATVSDSNGRFQMKALAPGKYWLTVSQSSQAGKPALKSIAADGVVINQQSVDLETGTGPATLEIILTNEPTEILGSITDPIGRPISSYGIVAFPATNALRASGSPLLRFTLASQDGSFSFVGLPPGDYFIAAVSAVEPGEVLDPDVLDRIQPLAVSVTLKDGQRLRIQLQTAK